ncbi:hypothetical protein N658DRAFT_421236 [Parathielavia hyrcaniae]|uniref:Transmembrane protein n=1 Tax=Parathielavia hyrcaniae TaxID=113614 RepID=A0AAN6T3H1_9PEZI|nr:hypothetical protein N658DRAFT_421236 [Parathielavia hyrcaniae]
MAESSSKDPGPTPPPLRTPSSIFTPSPLTPTGTRPRLGTRRQSRFTEDMAERTPAASISERSLDYYWYGPSAEDINTNTNNTNVYAVPPSTGPEPADTAVDNQGTWIRFANGALHAVPCLVMVAIMGYAMRVLGEDMGSYMSIQAIVLFCVLSADIALDIVTLFRVQTPWPTWGLALRSICGIAYIVLFLVYVGLGGPFPAEYTYWGLPTHSAAPVLYFLLSIEGLWNLIHIPICRYGLGSTLVLRGTTPTATSATSSSSSSPSPTLRHQTSFNHHHHHRRFSVAGTEHSSISLTWRRWVLRTRSTQDSLSRDDLENGGRGGRGGFSRREPSADLTLREQPGKEEGGQDDEAGSSRASGSSHGGCGGDEKPGEGGGRTMDEKWREGRPGRPGRPEETVGVVVRSKDVGQ